MSQPTEQPGTTAVSSAIDETFIRKLKHQDRNSVARAISIVERGGTRAEILMNSLYSSIGKAHRIGITGPPGAGKSTLIAQLSKHLSHQGLSVGIIAVDPSSPVTDGALLGDRIRMTGLNTEASVETGIETNVFIRSMASRGKHGGISAATCDAADIMDVAGFEYLLIESVGVGQVELEITKIVDSTIVLLVPESGDQIQAIKAGLMEVADIYLLNKYDRPGSHNALASLQSALGLKPREQTAWQPQVLAISASQGEGIGEIHQEIIKHQAHLDSEGNREKRRLSGVQSRVKEIVNERVMASLWNQARADQLKDSASAVMQGDISAHQLARDIVADFISAPLTNKQTK